MNIIQITPAGRSSKSGNRTTAERWARMLHGIGHKITTATEYHGQPAELMLALHAWYSHDAIAGFRARYPDRPIILALTGTDINENIHSDPDTTLDSLNTADALIGFHDRVRDIIPEAFRRKLNIIYQSARPLTGKRNPSKRHFDICVIGHLRPVKDPLRAAMAVRELPPASRIRVIHLGRALDPGLRQAAETEMKTNPRYLWKGAVPGWQVRRELLRSHLMVISSRSEGGANVVSEAVVAGVPVVASAIDGNIGLLGDYYGGYYPVGDTDTLRELLLELEDNPAQLAQLEKQCITRRSLFMPAAEQQTLGKLIDNLMSQA